MISLLLAVHLLIFGGIPHSSKAEDDSSKQKKIAVIPINTPGMPVRIITATLQDSIVESWLDFSISNISEEDVRNVDFRFFVADSTGKLVKAKETFSSAAIAPGKTLNERTRVEGTIANRAICFVAVSRAVVKSGIWQLELTALEEIVRSRLKGEPQVLLEPTFEAHLTVTEIDRAQIFDLAIRDVLGDEQKAKRLLSQSNWIVLRRGVDFRLPEIPERTLVVLNDHEIQQIADREDQIVFLDYERLIVEGSRVFARIALRDAVTRRRSVHVRYGYTFLFTCVKKNDRWVIEKSIGYAQS